MPSHHSSRTGRILEDFKIAGFAIGCQAWTFRDFTVFEAIEKTAAAGGRVIEFYPGQKLSPGRRRVAFDHNSPAEIIALVKDHLKTNGIRAINYGVLAVPNDESGARKIFEFAKKLGLYGITTESTASIYLLEKLAVKYDIRVGFHNHPRRPKDPGYLLWDPNYVKKLVSGRDPHIGATADPGHWVRSGLDPVACLNILRGRIISVHLKDVSAKSADAHDVPFGTGCCNIPGLLKELKRQKFAGNVSIEHEYNWANNVIDVAQCIGFVRGFGAK